ncbi:MAG: tRNA pseudouridine(55) synthase TruB [Bacteroidetes bacterium]|nr:tRNA pseudouridine(55) synthase TruB [Bacteroidota bacterium]
MAAEKPSLEALIAGTVLLVDKPLRWTSFDVINKLRRPLKAKMGHAGTLDPLATGLLIVCTGNFTKRISEYQRMPKEYTGIIELGAVTPTYDLESEPQDFKSPEGITENMLQEATRQFTGEILQAPPIHSAIKKDGKRAYELARAGKEIKLDLRPVTIAAFELTKISLPELHFRVACSTGTYIRSLAHDFGQALGCGGYLKALRRTQIGGFRVEEAPGVEEWLAHFRAEKERAQQA